MEPLSRRTFMKLVTATAGAAGLSAAAPSATVQAKEGGGVMLPAPDAPNKGTSAFFAKDATYPAIEPVRPPAGAPNVLIVLIDDMGFGASQRIWRPHPHADPPAAG